MKKILLITLFIPFQLFAQTFSKDKLVGEWVKTDIRTKDGSAIFSPAIKEATIRYIFQGNSGILITYNGKTSKSIYELRGNKLSFGTDNKFIIEKLTDTQLILQEDSTSAQPIKVFMEPARFHNVGFLPETYITKGNDTIYVAKRNFLEPYFLDSRTNVMEFIYENFDFPESKKGTFLIRFIITNKGELKAPKILESSQEKYNDKLIKALERTRGKWQSARWEGNSVNTEMTLFFDMKPPENEQNTNTTPKKGEQDVNLSNQYFEAGTNYFEEKKYRQALEYFNKSIELDTYNVNAYYNRAACYIMVKQKDAACKDFKTLTQLEQKRGAELYKKYCEVK
jgi:tetratricopeptide (TPR) repeat protein